MKFWFDDQEVKSLLKKFIESADTDTLCRLLEQNFDHFASVSYKEEGFVAILNGTLLFYENESYRNITTDDFRTIEDLSELTFVSDCCFKSIEQGDIFEFSLGGVVVAVLSLYSPHGILDLDF